MLLLALFVAAVVSSQKSPDNNCLEGFLPLTEDWCFTTLERGIYTFQDAEEACYSKSQSHLPTLSTTELNDAVVIIRDSFFGPNSFVWIGLNCSEDGYWYWLDGTPYDTNQAHFDPKTWQTRDPLHCDPTQTTAFDLSLAGYWQPLASESQLIDVICTKRTEDSGRTPSPDDLICPGDYRRVEANGEIWCFAYNTPMPPLSSVKFEQAKQLCEEREGETLPILESDEVVDALDTFMTDNTAYFIWIGIVCNHDTMEWVWEKEGDAMNYTNFESVPPDPCNDDFRFVQTYDSKQWQKVSTASQFASYVCARRASPTLPPLPTLPSSLDCPHGMYLLHDWCYSFDISPIGEVDYQVNSEEKEDEEENLHNFCQIRYGGFLPSVSSQQESEDLIFIRRYHLGVDSENLWMSLECGEKSKWEWKNGEPWSDYTKFVSGEDPVSCNFNIMDPGHLFDATGNWIDGTDQKAKYVACSRRPNGYFTASTAVSTTKSALVCPENYAPFKVDGEEWCFMMNIPIPPATGMGFDYARKMCEVREGETLPILKSKSMVDALSVYRSALGTDKLWIGIVCNEVTGQWEWPDGDAVEYNRFAEDETGNCTPSYAFAQNVFKEEWVKLSTFTLLPEYVCIRRAQPSEPPLPTPPPSQLCPQDMFLLGEWCYGFKKPIPESNFLTAEYICERDFRATLPSISSETEAENLIFIRRYYLGSDSEELWIGMQCGNDGKWFWENGEPWNGYNKFMDGEDVNSCSHDDHNDFLFNRAGVWINGTGVNTKYIVCTVRYSETTVITTTQLPERCPPKFLELIYGKCIKAKVWKEFVTFDENVKLCNDSHAMLPSIASVEENTAYVNLLESNTGTSSFWLGLLCVANEDDPENGTYQWLDGTPFAYSNFVDPVFFPDHGSWCSPLRDDVFTFEIGGKWDYQDRAGAVKRGICVTPADMSVPTPVPVFCDDGWESIDGSCFYFDPTKKKLSWWNAKNECEKLDANLPSITSMDQNERVYYSTFHLMTTANAQFWLGLQCGDDGKFSWLDETPYAYNNLLPLFSICSNSKMGYAFANDGHWIQKDEQSGEAVFLACSKPGSTSPAPTTTTSTTVTSTVTTTSSTTAATSTTSRTTTTTTTPEPTTTTSPPAGFPVWAIILICVASVLIIALCTFLGFMARKRIKRLEAEIVEIERHDSRTNSNKVNNSLYPNSIAPRYYNLPNRVDEWEIERKFVGIDYTNKLGEGAFGSVFLGRVLAKNIPLAAGKSIVEMTALRNDNDSVAVKMLHENADTMAETDFKAEIDLMKKIGYHERLVNILACVTQSEPILLITEYCANGDLLEFMRERRKYMIEHTSHYDEDKIITAKQQVMFAIQEYLATRGFLHRDIAARNIMVDHQETCKIGDFGLCRAIGRENENYQAQGGKLPLKWMSPEAIDKYFFSTASDVWSYGILLFEIVTLGGTPYAGWPAADLLNKLKRGDRMEKPDNCSEKLFEVMLNCWAELPSERPTFTKLRKRLGKLLEDVNQDDYYLKLNAQANYYVFESEEI